MSVSSTTPWTEWAYELPTTLDEVKTAPEFELLNSKNHLRSMLQQVRHKFINMAKMRFERTEGAAIVLQGGKMSDFEWYDTDTTTTTFRQEHFFRYLFGLNEGDAMGIIDLEREELILLVSFIPVEYERFLGERRTLEYYTNEYDVTVTTHVDEIDNVLQQRGITYLYVLEGTNSDSGLQTKTTANFNGIDKYWVDRSQLYPLLAECRVSKTPAEIELLRAACKITSQAHVYVMRHLRAGMMERQLEALFKAWSYYYGGSRHQAYDCICCSGPNGATLHYGHAGYPNDRFLQPDECVLLDMGSEYQGYATDITCSYPVNGVFSDDQRAIHTAVYEAQQAVLENLRPGVSWKDMHRLSETVILRHLLEIGVVRCELENTDEAIALLMENHVGSLFMPHGLGHFIGMLVHDVGGYNEEFPASEELGLCWLRTTRDLCEGMCVTVEPGIYFNNSWIRQMREKHPNVMNYVNNDVLSRFLGTGGVRLEDCVLITSDGYENLTLCPRSCEDIEDVMSRARQSHD